METPAELREEARRCQMAFDAESHPMVKRALVRHAFALAQLAEAIEREQKRRERAEVRGFE